MNEDDAKREMIHDDGEAHCPSPGCDFWAPAGMEYLYLSHN